MITLQIETFNNFSSWRCEKVLAHRIFRAEVNAIGRVMKFTTKYNEIIRSKNWKCIQISLEITTGGKNRPHLEW